MDAIAGSPVLSHIGSDKHAEEVYFSFITLTTVGYGDIAPVARAARMTSVIEALFGQLYLVTIVAVIVSNVGSRGCACGVAVVMWRRGRADGEGRELVSSQEASSSKHSPTGLARNSPYLSVEL